MKCAKCGAHTAVRNTLPQTAFDTEVGRTVPVVIRYRVCEPCGATRKTVEVTADVLLRLTSNKETQ